MDHRVYFGGQVQSLRFQSGLIEASVGVINPGEYSFSTESAERVQILTGSVQFRMSDQKWRRVVAGDSYEVPPGITFEIECREQAAFLLLNLALAFYKVGTIWAHELDIFARSENSLPESKSAT